MDNKSLKIGFSVFAVFAVVFGVLRLGQIIRITNNTGDNQREKQYANALEDAKSRVIDTDEDGLTDWEEENLFGTSIYLADSDSDGINDKNEIDQGTDPNCEQGKTCGSDIIGIVEEVQDEIDAQAELEGAQDKELITDFSSDSQEAMDALEQGTMPSAGQIRSLLRDSGVPESQVNLATDEELLQLFQEVSEQQ